ncbi:MAG: TetR/AcrR family transcriptional regulator, partial [Actinomycetota bacterium]|nr:TetR/AcrR family transcriptional regulator [Actinomycetota bacterium]
MDDIAASAGVGKGTLFRAFGSRDGLLDAVFEVRLKPWRAELERPGSTIGPDVPPADRVIAILGHLLAFKLDNSRLIAARELDGSTLLRAPHYTWVHHLLRDLIAQAGSPPDTATYAAHVLLGGLRAELIDDLLAAGQTADDISRELLKVARQILRAVPLHDGPFADDNLR